MSTITRRTFAKGLAAAPLLALAGCSAGTDAPAGSDAGSSTAGAASQVVVVLDPSAEPEAGFNPIINWGSGEHMHEPLIQSTLLKTDADLNFQNDLATDYRMSDDGLTWTFVIRDDVKFTDGEPLTAADVAFTINTIVTTAASESDLSMVDDAVALDDTTVAIHLNRPYNALLYLLAVVGIVPEHAYGDDYGENPIGSGRYVLEQWDRGQQVIFRANPDYYGDAPQMQRVVVLFMSEDASLAAAAAGEVDLATTSAILAGQVPEGYSVLSCKSVDSRGLALPVPPAGGTKEVDGETYNVGNAVTSNVEIRQAINYAVDRERFVDNVLSGYGTVAYSVGTGMPWYSEDMEAPYDPDHAAQILTDAGWAKGDDGIWAKGDLRAEFDVWYNSADSARQGIALEFANQMAEFGMKVTANGAGWDELYPHEFSDPIVWGFGSNAPFEIYSLYASDGSFNVASYESEAVDEYLNEALAQPTVEDSFAYWKMAQWDGTTGIAPKGDAPWVWIANIDHLFFQRDGLNVAAQKPHPHGHGWSVLNNVDEWSW